MTVIANFSFSTLHTTFYLSMTGHTLGIYSKHLDRSPVYYRLTPCLDYVRNPEYPKRNPQRHGGLCKNANLTPENGSEMQQQLQNFYKYLHSFISAFVLCSQYLFFVRFKGCPIIAVAAKPGGPEASETEEAQGITELIEVAFKHAFINN